MGEYRDIAGYEGIYRINSSGSVWSVKHKRKLKPRYNKYGYIRCALFKDGKYKYYFVHRLVLNAFIGNSELSCNHKNGIKRDNRIENLEWVTRSANMFHAYRTGLAHGNKGEQSPHAKLNDSDVIRIKTIRKNCKVERGYWEKLSRALKINPATMCDINKGKNWNHITV